MQTEKYVFYSHRPARTADDSIPADIQYIRLKTFITCDAKSQNTVFRSIYNFKTDKNK